MRMETTYETTYISEDGKRFKTEKACREHEENKVKMWKGSI